MNEMSEHESIERDSSSDALLAALRQQFQMLTLLDRVRLPANVSPSAPAVAAGNPILAPKAALHTAADTGNADSGAALVQTKPATISDSQVLGNAVDTVLLPKLDTLARALDSATASIEGLRVNIADLTLRIGAVPINATPAAQTQVPPSALAVLQSTPTDRIANSNLAADVKPLTVLIRNPLAKVGSNVLLEYLERKDSDARADAEIGPLLEEVRALSRVRKTATTDGQRQAIDLRLRERIQTTENILRPLLSQVSHTAPVGANPIFGIPTGNALTAATRIDWSLIAYAAMAELATESGAKVRMDPELMEHALSSVAGKTKGLEHIEYNGEVKLKLTSDDPRLSVCDVRADPGLKIDPSLGCNSAFMYR